MIFLTSFIAGIISTFLIGAVSRLIALRFASESSAAIAGFAIALGFVVGRVSYEGPMNAEALIVVCRLIGSGIALLGLWYWLLRRDAA